MQNRQQAFNNISRELAIGIQDIKQRQAIQDYSLNIHAENFFRDVFNWVYDCHFENANFQSANAACIDLLDTQQKLAYQITSTTSKEKIANTLQALAKPEYQGYEIRIYYLLAKPYLSAKSKQEIRTDFALNIDEYLFDCSDLIKDINNLETDKLIALNHKYFKETEQITGDIVEVDIFHLPEPTTALIGRKTELKQLTEAFKNPNKRLAIIVAAGGIGKSALTDEWLRQIEAQNYYGKTRVFGWSVYSQGSHNTFADSQPFFSAVFEFLNKHRPKDDQIEIPKEEIEKAPVLVRCLQQMPCLLILDGLEPLQNPENLQAMSGELKDSALKEFIACFRRTAGESFVLLSSRQPLVELKKWQAEHYLSLDLKTLPHDDGADLLQALGVTGKAAERQVISKDLNGHALSLVLMGHLLSEHHQGDCRYAKELPPLTSAHGDSDAEKDSRHALRLLDYYDSLQDEASRCFLQLLGLFDRSMNAAEKAILIANSNHAEPLRALTDSEWKKVEQRLEKSGVLFGKKGSFERLEWDTHPIIRAYFGEKFKENYPEAFKQAHWGLFDYYQKLPEKEFPDNLDEMQPLYRAVVHGCLAGKYQQALENVFYPRIWRSDESYSVHKLGAYSQDITALAAFFPSGWDKPVQSEPVQQAFMLSAVSFRLMSLGRLQEAIEAREIGIKLSEKLGNWKTASIANHNLVELYLSLGQLSLAHIAAQQAMKYAQRSEGTSEQMKSQCYLATVLHRCGHLSEAYQHFQKAEELDQSLGYHYLSSLGGFWYCILLSDTAHDKTSLQAVEERAYYSLDIFFSKNHLVSIALDFLTVASVGAALKQFPQAENIFQQAIQRIEKAGRTNETPLFYLYRADFFLTQNQLDPALADLNSAWEIIERCGMKLYAVDYLLIHGRYCLDIKDHDTALNHYEEAKQLIQETGYHLRDAELDLFAAKLRQLDLPEYQRTNPELYSKNADYYLQKVKNRIAEIGQWGLMRVIERDFPENSKGV
ncbi:ATP/maltotriose-dependent transcriptional regulator MalT [Methylobacter tundripaludum]|uniref:ATP/maltotriose-dependent transcriptional regulator MalT n=1 Tax=Methylobacter tundripaludum TaxID=173365 RepID=A0A2S6HBK6_9GAMM|nr:SMEK domain-containing protein [Methylobacter tundripaludum]PPK74875.1 ATP/maltotriose-dependent transcriptional regulator MalT [Methylobacter tundripaludum]